MNERENYHLGFSGSREGFTEVQEKLLCSLLEALDKKHGGKVSFHHGDCIGADEGAHCLASSLGWEVIIHPPIKEKYRAFCKSDLILPSYTYKTRNKHIVQQSSALIATPKREEDHSGTWQTIRLAKDLPRIVILPKGLVYKGRPGEPLKFFL